MRKEERRGIDILRVDMREAIERIRAALRGPLPGLRAQEKMMPESRRRENLDRNNWKKAAVLILLYPRDGALWFPLTLRRDDLPSHPGQVSLPGGSVEAGEGIEEAALREAREEIGIDETSVELLGRLSPLRIPPSGFEIDPVVGWTALRPGFVPEEREVAEIIEVPLAMLLSEDSKAVEEWELHGGSSAVPLWKIGRHKVWGATAMVLSELAALF